MSEITLLKTLNVKNLLGECILWDEISQSTWWTDIHNAVLYQYHYSSETLEKFALPERLCSFGFIENDERLICAFESGFAYYDTRSTSVEWIYRPEKEFQGTRFNDGRVDRQGRFWSGTMVEGLAGDENEAKAFDAEGRAVKGSLYWVQATKHGQALTDLEIPNSLCWSSDSKTVYFSDSPSQQILSFEFDSSSAEFSRQKTFTSTNADITPDGSTIDSQGYLWNAQWGGSKVIRYSPSGEQVDEVNLPVTQATCICFGGPDLDLLFVSTAREHLSEEQLQAQTEAGNVFIFKTPYQGLPESRFTLAP